MTSFLKVTSSAGRAKKLWGKCWVVVVAMGVAWVMLLVPSCCQPNN